MQKALILSAGLGTRLRPITETMPKAMVPIVNHPILEYNLALCKRHGIKEVAINLHYFPEVIKEHFGHEYEGMTITYSYEQDLLENAGAVKKLEDFFAGEDNFLVLASDNLIDLDLLAMENAHKDNNALVTIATVTADDVSKYGIAQIDEQQRIITFQEKPLPKEALGDQVATCIYIFSSHIFEHIPQGVPVHFGKTTFPQLLEAGESLYAFRYNGYWNDVGNPQNFKQANFDVLEGKMVFPFGKLPQDKNNIIGKDVVVGKDVHLEQSILFDNTVVEYSTMKHCILCKDTAVNHCVLDTVVAGHQCALRDATLADVAIWPESKIKGLS